MEVTASGTRDGRPFRATHFFLTSLRTTPEGLLQLVRVRWGIEGWHWIRDTRLHEEVRRYRGNGAGMIATLRRRFVLAAPCWVPVNSNRLAGGDARHHGAAGDGGAPTRTPSLPRL